MCPLPPDDTDWGAQQWNILAPRLHQICHIPLKTSSYCRTPDEALFNPANRWDAWSKLAIPASTTSIDFANHTPLSSRRTQASVLESLPAEIIFNLLPCLSDSPTAKTDIISFGLASSTLWPYAIHYIHRTTRNRSMAPWGMYLPPFSLPFSIKSPLADHAPNAPPHLNTA